MIDSVKWDSKTDSECIAALIWQELTAENLCGFGPDREELMPVLAYYNDSVTASAIAMPFNVAAWFDLIPALFNYIEPPRIPPVADGIFNGDTSKMLPMGGSPRCG